jgi:predicted RNA-binding Zn-ribbon protein involved in translation (DUF1610 family)
MSSFITTPCPGCGPRDIGIDHVTLLVGGATPATASIHCPECGASFTTRVDDGMGLLLATVGVAIRTIGADPTRTDEGTPGPITAVEVEVFVHRLEIADDLVALLGG